MSRRPAASSFASKGMFDALADDGDDYEEEEAEEPIHLEKPSPHSSSSAPKSSEPVPLSKSAKKRLARQAAKQVNGHPTSIPPPVSDDSRATSPVSPTTEITSENRSDSVPVAMAIAKTNGVNGDHVSQPTLETDSTKTSLGPVPPTIVGADKSPPSSKFKPELPSTLPEPTGSALPANRKRKTPQDFTPSGPRDTPTPTSPSKISVKFEDGLAPGEGKEGEKVIPKVVVAKKDRNMVERTIWTFIMIGVFIALLCLGQPYMILLVMVCQTLVYKEVTALFDLRDKGSKSNPDSDDRWSKTLNWYFFVVTNYFLYGESIIYYFKHIVFVDAYFIPFARNHRFISFMLYVVGFVGFVANLQRQYLRRQFALFCWVHISLLLIVVSSHFIVNNILEGLVWFFVPASLVICNDVMAYICGKTFGRTPLIKLSPKKTMEGFIGAFICTLVFGWAWGTFFMRFPYMICPARDLGTNIFSNVVCKPNPVFVWRDFESTGAARNVLKAILGRAPPAIPYAPFQIHVLVMATFASLVAPFGGFFASGFKRAFDIKDFGHSIPGHGGMTDRMDCQFMMGMFSYVYYSSLVRLQYVDVGTVMQTIVTSLPVSEQVELFHDLRRFLQGQGVKV